MSDDRAQARGALADVLGATDLQALIVDRAGRIIHATPRMDEVFAEPGGSLVHAPFDSVFSPRNPQWFSSDIRKNAAAGCWTGDAVLRKHDGSECWAHMQACRLPGSASSAANLLIIVEDVTERVELTDALMRRTQELYDRNWELEIVGKVGRLLLANTDLDSRLNYVLREAARSIGVDGALLLINDRHTQDLVCRAACGHTRAGMMVGFRIGPDQESLARHTVRSRRTQVATDLSTEPHVIKELTDAYGVKSILSVPIVANDEAFGAMVLCSMRPRSFAPEEVALVEIITNYAAFAVYNAFLGEDIVLSRANWQRTLDAIEDLAAVVDPLGTIITVNEAMARLLGSSVPNLVGQDCSELHPEIDSRLLANLVEGGKAQSFGDITIGGEICEGSAFPLIDGAGRVDSIVFYGKIITSERRLRDEFRKASRLASVGELLAGTAHSFGNVLMAIQGTLEAARNAPSEDNADKIVQALAHAAKGAEIVRRLLSFSRGVEEAPGRVSLSDVVEAALGLCKAHPSAKQRTITSLIPPDLPCVEARPGPLQEVILNLVLNSLQATDPGGEVRIEAEVIAPRIAAAAIPPGMDVRRDDVDDPSGDVRECAYLRITDTGCGMSAETIDRIFEPFFSTKGGTGLGLSTSAAAIHRMGGTITVESEPSKGTTFTIRLNLKDRKPAEQPKAA